MSGVSVIICTHDRAAVVGRAVEAALEQARAVGAEILVVNNASTDSTSAVLESIVLRNGDMVRSVDEPRLGLSAARNRGLAEARGEIAVFLDDDAVPRPGWLAALVAPFAASAVACVGGPIILRFPGGMPSWFRPELAPALSAFDLGTRPRRLRYGRPGDEYPYGANIAFRVAHARAVGGFSTLLGPRGRQSRVHDETDLCYRIDEAGGEIHYAPDAVLEHWVLPERLTPQWLLGRHWDGGRSAAIFVLRNRGVLRALWRLRWCYGSALLTRPYAAHDPLDPDRFLAECRRREAVGYLVGLADGLGRLRILQSDRRTTAECAAASASATKTSPGQLRSA